MKSPSGNTSPVLKIVLVLLILLLLALLFLYYRLIQPPIDVVPRTEQFQHLLSVYGYGPKPEQQLKRPSDVAFDRGGNMYVADTGNARILVFNQKGGFIRRIGAKGYGKGRLRSPIGIAVDDLDKVYVADQALNKLVVYKPNGEVRQEMRVDSPLKPVIWKDRLYLTTDAHVLVYPLDGLHKSEELFRWGRQGKGQGEFSSPVGLAVDSNGAVFVSDLNNLRLQAFDPRGQFEWAIGKPPTETMAAGRRFGLPAGLAADDRGFLYLVDAFNHRIEVMTDEGSRVAVLSGQGQKEGELYFPQGIAYRAADLFAVADKYNDRVQLLRITPR